MNISVLVPNFFEVKQAIFFSEVFFERMMFVGASLIRKEFAALFFWVELSLQNTLQEAKEGERKMSFFVQKSVMNATTIQTARDEGLMIMMNNPTVKMLIIKNEALWWWPVFGSRRKLYKVQYAIEFCLLDSYFGAASFFSLYCGNRPRNESSSEEHAASGVCVPVHLGRSWVWRQLCKNCLSFFEFFRNNQNASTSGPKQSRQRTWKKKNKEE